MTEECKEMEQQAKEQEREDPGKAVLLYKETAQCYAKHDDEKRKNSNYEKAAKLLWQQARSIDDPEMALSIYEQSSSIFMQIDKEKDANKVLEEANKKFVDAAKQLHSDAKKADDLPEAEEKIAIASKYYVQGEEREQSLSVWVDLGDWYYKAGDNLDDPLQALDRFNNAIKHYRTGEDEEKEYKATNEAGVKFYKKGEEILKDNTNLIIAYYYFAQAAGIFIYLAEAEKQVYAEEKMTEIREIMGMPDDVLMTYLSSAGLNPVRIIPEEKDTAPQTKDLPESDPSPAQDTPAVQQRAKAEVGVPAESPPVSTHGFTAQEKEPIQDEPSIPSTQPNLTAPTSSDFRTEHRPETASNLEKTAVVREQVAPGQPDFGTTPTQKSRPEPTKAKTRPSGAKPLTPQTVQPQLTREAEQSAPKFNVPTTGPIIDMLHKQGYISNTAPTPQELQKAPEYQILSIIIQYHPISLEDLENMTDVTSISMVLSNLTADGLVEQTPEFKYTLTDMAKNILH